MADPEENRSGDPVEQDPGSPESPRPRRPGGLLAGVASTPFAPRWGRLAVALLGAAALSAALFTAVLGILGIVSPLVPLLCLVVAGAAVAVLRALAVRSRRARVDRAFAEAMAPMRSVEPELEPSVVLPPVPARPQRPTVLFDAEGATPQQASPIALRTVALSTASGSSAVAVRNEDGEQAGTGTVVEPESEDTDAAPVAATSWAPVEIPRPSYVESAKAERQAPAPLDLPEAPKAQSRIPIKTAEAAARRAESSGEPADTAGVPGRRMDLDNVLQRRRA